MTVSFVECAAEQLPALQEFLGRVYCPEYVLRVNEPLFRWQFGEAADPRKFNLKLALLDNVIAGCLGWMPVEVTLAGRRARGAWVVNWMVDPEYRRLGLGPLLMREVTKQFDLTLNIGPNADAANALRRMGWVDFGELNRHVCVLDAKAVAILTESGKLDWPATPQTNSPVTARPVKTFEASATTLWDELAANSSQSGARRSAEYLNWRYAAHPVFDYRRLEIEHGGRLRGFAVFRVEPVRDLPVRIGRITEFVAGPDGADDLAMAVLNDARSQQVAVLDFFCSSGRLADAMERNGFLSGEGSPAAQVPILFQPIDRRRSGIRFMAFGKDVPAIKAQDWFVTKGDGDQDRPN